MAEQPIQGIVPLGRAGEPIKLFEGAGTVDGVAVGDLAIWMAAKRGCDLCWSSTGRFWEPTLGQRLLRFRHPRFGEVELPVRQNNSEGRGDWATAEFGSGVGLQRVVVHWMNLPEIVPATPLQVGGRTWLGRWTASAGGWRLTLDLRPDHAEILRAADLEDEQYVVTHIGELRREDGRSFEAGEAEDVLFGWQLALSFALGRWVAPAVPVGFDAQGEPVWEQWAPWRCDTLRGYESWWDTHTSDDLASFAEAFLTEYLQPDERAVVRHMVMHLIAANHAGTTAEAKVMLAQAAIEYFSWVTFVLGGQMSEDAHDHQSFADRLRQLLTAAGIPPEVPPGLDGLDAHVLGLKPKWRDGPGAIVSVRNCLVHPKDPEEPYMIEGLVWQAARLLREFGCLLLLHRLGYRGRFLRLYPPGRWAHSSEPVPWAVS